MGVISYRSTKKALRRIVNARGHEYTYEHPTYENEYGEVIETGKCHYSDSLGKPSCLVGALLHELAPTEYKRLHQYEWGSPYSPESASTHDLVGVDSCVSGVHLDTLFDERALRLLHQVQVWQDVGKSWGEALDKGIERTGS